MIPAELLAKKRDGQELSADEISQFVGAYVDGNVADYQMSAMAMAICIRGMTTNETVTLTQSMLRSGASLRWDSALPLRVDKHSTGGLGDKTSLILAPLLACFDLPVPMISGRGLGITGGTLDKLESIPGFRTQLSLEEAQRQVSRCGCVITGATSDLAPADRKLYALRDVTGTVESIPLITASILSKKLAESLTHLVIDVKFGSAAFMKTLEDARRLADSLVHVATQMEVATTAVLSDMNQPLGRMVGNAIEVHESVDVLQGKGPPDVRRLVEVLAAELLVATGRAASRADAIQQIGTCLESGRAFERFETMVSEQGGQLPAVAPAPSSEWLADRSGQLVGLRCELLGQAVIEMGGGRKRLGDVIDPTVGLEMLVRLGDSVEAGQPVVRLFAPKHLRELAERRVRSALIFEADSPAFQPPPLLVELRTASQVVSCSDAY